MPIVLHTPAPWIWSKDGRILLGDETTAFVVRLHPAFAVDKADKLLLAAAPDLLKTLHLIQEIAAGINARNCAAAREDLASLAIAAITKAEKGT